MPPHNDCAHLTFLCLEGLLRRRRKFEGVPPGSERRLKDSAFPFGTFSFREFEHPTLNYKASWTHETSKTSESFPCCRKHFGSRMRCGGGESSATPSGSSETILSAMKTELNRPWRRCRRAIHPHTLLAIRFRTGSTLGVRGPTGRCSRAVTTAAMARSADADRQLPAGRYTQAPDRQPSWTSPGTSAALDDDIPVLRREIWRETDRQYRAAVSGADQSKDQPAGAGTNGGRRRAGFFAGTPRTYIGPRVEITSTANPGKRKCAGIPLRSANRPRC